MIMIMRIICFVNKVTFSVYNGSFISLLRAMAKPGGRGGGELCDRPRQHSLRSGKMGHKMNTLNEKKIKICTHKILYYREKG